VDTKVRVGSVVLSAAIALSGCGSAGDKAQSSTAATSAPATSSAQTSAGARSGKFEGANGKKVSGTVKVAGDEVSLTDFSSDEGPDLHLYLANGTDESAVAAGKLLGPVAFDKASQTFSLNGADPAKYSTVVVHCDKAKATFGAAALT